MERFGGVAVDVGLGLGQVEGVGPGASVEVGQPSEAGDETFCHGVADIGEDAGGDAGALEVLRPGQHGEVDLAPEVEVGGDEGLDLIEEGLPFLPFLRSCVAPNVLNALGKAIVRVSDVY